MVFTKGYTPWNKGKKLSIKIRRNMKKFESIEENFYSKFIKLSNGCWQWTKKVSKTTGYAQFPVRKNLCVKHYLAHRFSYILHKGKIPKKYVIDHLCRNRSCVNPQHLQAVTLKENILRGESFAAKNARKTHCKKGHPLSGKNLYICTRGRRNCRICLCSNSKRYWNKIKHKISFNLKG